MARRLATLFAASLLLIAASCSKTTENVGNGLLPEGDHFGVYYTDTLHIECHSQIIDSMATKGMTTALLGSIVDPDLGRTTANLFTQLRLSATNQHFGNNPSIDSVVLQLGVIGYFGDTTTPQTLHVYELADSLRYETEYYQFSDIAAKPVDLANGYTFLPHPKTNSVVGNDTLSQAVIRIPLDHSLGVLLATADSSVYRSQQAFKNFFPGLKVSCEDATQNGSISYLLPTSNSLTKLELYYHEADNDIAMRYDYYITTDDCYFNQYLHDYSLGSDNFVQQVVEGDTALGQQILYLQSMGGVRTLLRFPNIETWGDTLQHEHLIINEAKLVLPISRTDAPGYATVASLALLSLNADGSTTVLPDYFEGSAYYGGSYSSSTRSVTFRISEYLQDLVSGKSQSQGLYLSITGAAYNAYRCIIPGPEFSGENVIKCNIKYSIIGE